MLHDALRGSGYIGQARPQDVTPSFEFGLSDLCRLCEKMSRTRRPLSSLSSFVNVNGDEAVGGRVPRERTHVERQALRMHERREETWRPLKQARVVAFIDLYLMAI